MMPITAYRKKDAFLVFLGGCSLRLMWGVSHDEPTSHHNAGTKTCSYYSHSIRKGNVSVNN